MFLKDNDSNMRLNGYNGYLSNHKVVCQCDFRPHV